MKKIFFLLLFLSPILVLNFNSCKKNVQAPPSVNKKPFSYAGPDQTIFLPKDSVELNGKGTDGDGNIVNYKWTKIFGPSQHLLVNGDKANAEVKKMVQGLYEFQLEVTDNGGLTARDKLTILVLDPSGDACAGCWDY